MSDAAMNVRLGAKTEKFNKAMTQASKRLKKFGRSVSAVGSRMSTMITLPLVAAGGASIKMSLDFQKSMTKIQTLVGKTDTDIKKMTDDILAMSGDVAKSPKDLAEGLYFLESAGLRGENAMNTLNSVAKASASGMGEMEALSVVAAAAQNAYGEETLSASDALDKFGVMVRTGMFDAEELSNVLGRQLGLASNLGISFDEVGALISTYTATTGDATAASNGLSAIMMTFAKLDAEPTKQQAEALAQIGMSAADVKEMMGTKGLMGTLQHLQTNFNANGVSMASFFSKSQALKGVLGVLGTQTETYTANLDAMADSQNFVKDAFDETANTDAFAMEQAMNNLTVAGTQLGQALAPVVQVISDKIMQLTQWWGGLSDETRASYAEWAIWIATAGPALVILGKTIGFVGTIIGLFKKWNVVTKIVAGSQKLLNLIMTANPIGLIITAIGAVIAAFVYFGTSTSNLAIKVRNGFKSMMNGVIRAINSVIKGINKYSKHLGFTLGTIKEFEMENLKSADAVDENSDKVEDLAKNLEKIPTNVTPKVDIDFGDDGGGSDTGGGDDGQAEKDKKEAERLEKEKEQIVLRSEQNISRLKQQFNVLNAKNQQESELIALENSRQNALDGVKDSEKAEEEKQAIVDLYDLKKKKLLEKHADDNKKAAEKTKSEWEKTYDSLKEGWNAVSNVANQIMGGISATLDAINEKETIQMENKHARENEDYELWYERELQKIEDKKLTEEEKNKMIEELDEAASTKKVDLEKKQEKEMGKIKRKKAKQDKAMNIMSAVMGTAAAIVQALAVAPPLGFVLAGIVGAMGAAQIAAIASTPIPAMAEGGIAFGPTTALVGEYQGAQANPEVIAPLNKLKGLLKQDTQKVEVFGTLKGNDIFLSNEIANTNRLRFT